MGNAHECMLDQYFLTETTGEVDCGLIVEATYGDRLITVCLCLQVDADDVMPRPRKKIRWAQIIAV